MLRHFAVFFLLADQISAQISSSDWAVLGQCDVPVVACHYVSDTIDSCVTKQTSAETVACYCTQKLFESFYNCKNEINACTQANSLFDLNNLTSIWHEACDSRISTTFTTPVLITMSATPFNHTTASTINAPVTGSIVGQGPPSLPSSTSTSQPTSVSFASRASMLVCNLSYAVSIAVCVGVFLCGSY